MQDTGDVYLKIINSLYLTLSKTAAIMPFGSRYWLEEITRGIGESLLESYGEQFLPASKNPLEICNAYLNFLGHRDFLERDSFSLEEDEEEILVTMRRERCVYREFCLGAEKEGLLFYCPRLGALQAALRRSLDREYSTTVSIDRGAGSCRGRIFPQRRRLKTEAVRREGDVITIEGERAVLFHKDIYTSFLATVKEYAPFILKKVLFDAGYRSYLVIARHAREGCGTPEDALRVSFEELRNYGLGRVELASLDAAAGHAVIRCYHSFEAAVLEDVELYRTPRVTCDLLRGKLSACLTVILGRPITCEEMKCASVEGDCCEFHAYPEEEMAEGV